MKSFLSILFLLSLAVGIRADDANSKDVPPEEKAIESRAFQFDGIWKPKGAMLRGVVLPPSALDAITLRITGGKYEVTVKGEEHSDKGRFILDETVTPKRMTLKSVSGPNKGKILLAIYEIKGENAMRVCYDLSGKAFPKEFKAPKDSDLYLVGYRRQKAVDSEEKPNRTEPERVSDSTDQ